MNEGLIEWGHSSAGRAPALHAGGREFDPPWLHHTQRKTVLYQAKEASQKVFCYLGLIPHDNAQKFFLTGFLAVTYLKGRCTLTKWESISR